jgi:hypothetical protein
MEEKMKIAYGLALFCALGILPLAGQAPEPTYKETIDWIVNKLASDAGYQKYGSDVTIQNPSIDHCTLHYIEHHDISARQKSWVETKEVTIPLATVISTGVHYQAFQSFTKVSSLTNSFHLLKEDLLRNSRNEQTSDHEFIPFGRPGVDDTDMAKRMANAIEHAAKICKAQAPKSNEPF